MRAIIFSLILFAGGIMAIEKETLTITVIYDNNAFNPKLKTGWGFSCIVKGTEKTLLFDTGSDNEILLSNMESLGIDPAEIKLVVLSHNHWDHVGGLFRFLKVNSKVEIWLPKSFSDNFKARIKNYKACYQEITDSARIGEGVYSTGEMGTWIKEQSLILKTDKGLVVITGCAHPGIVEIVAKTKNWLKEKVYLVLGGFHLSGCSDRELKNIIGQFRKLGVEKVGPCHCSGERCRELFKREYHEDFVEIAAGSILRIE
jgi:7,8-dihydropterin-6-yl-methyl-4-(beta-D-ribofuranosyl)aminobenzene 5'-phosphate synthase